jgi:hypothetical protein
MAAQRFRVKYLFWLDMAKSDEFAVAEQIEDLKQNRTFAKTIRDGIRLICDLRAGRLDVLFELFPWVQAEFAKPEKAVGVLSLQVQLERLEQIMLEQGAIQIERPLLTNGPKPLPTPKLVAPVFDDEDQDTIVIQRSTSTDAGANFINAMMGLQE